MNDYNIFQTNWCNCNKEIKIAVPVELNCVHGAFYYNNCVSENSPARDGINVSIFTEASCI